MDGIKMESRWNRIDIIFNKDLKIKVGKEFLKR